MKKARGGRAFASAAKGTTDTRDESRAGGSFTIVGIGASAGGLEAFSALLKHLPLDTGMGFVLVQHLDPEHDSALAQLLGRATSLPVHEVTNNLHVEPNHVYVIPPNTNLGIASGVLTLLPRPKTRTPHRSIDFFLEALAEDQRDRAIGVILSGTATDGTLGLEAIKAEGGITFAQDDSARYDSMPRSAVAAGCVDFVMSPEDIAHEIARIAKHPAVARVASGSSTRAEDDRTAATTHEDDGTPLPSGGRGRPATGAEQARAEADHGGMERIGARAENGFKTILLLLRNHSGVDFSLYKSTTIQRRITRRMVLSKQNTHDDYAQFLRGNAKELDALYSDVLISVTSFFRTPEAFDVLQRTVFPRLLQQRTDDPLRVWVLGCSTGQEAYSIAMAFVEAADKAPRMCKLQVFATDLNDVLLDKARHGLYAKTLAQDLSTERLRRFFVEEEGGYRVNKSLREMVVFARQNVIADPPFSRMDVISCRNLLIYFDAGLQKKIFPVFHYALKPGGFLYLGASESIGGFTDLFEPVDKKHKIYAKKAAPTPAFHLPARNDGERPARGSRQARRPLRMPLTPGGGTDAVRGELSVQREADRVTVHQFAPPAVLINAELQVLQFRGPTGAYLEPPSGKASFDLLKMARNGLMLPLRTAINKAKKDDRTVRKEHVRIEQDGRTRTVNVEVIPLKNLRERCFLIVFEDAGRAGPLAATARRKRRAAEPPAAHANRAAGPSESRRSAALEAELAETRDYLQSVQEQHEAANEELQASNEEVANEELNTVNDEMASRNAELNRLYSDLVNVQTSTQQAIVLLSRNLTIRRFSAQAEKQFNLLAADVGRPFSSVRHNLDVSDLDRCITEVIDSVRADEREVQDKDGRWFSLRVRPYLTLDNTVDGAVLVLVDISDLKRKELSIAVARDYAQAIIRTARDPLLILHADLRVDTANQAFYDTFKVSSTDAEGRLVYELGNHQWDIPGLRELLENILPRDRVFDQFEVTHDFETIGRRTMLLNARRLSGGADAPDKILLGIQDVTDQRENVALVRQSHARYQALVDTSAQIVWTTDALGCVVEDSPSWRAFTGQTYEQWQRTGWLDALHPDDRQRVHELWQRAVAEHTPVDTEYRLRHVNGDWRWAHVRAVPVLRPDGTVREWVGMNSDITERKQAEEKLRDSEQRFAKFMHHLPGLAWIKDSDGRYVYANDAAQDAFRTRRMELYGKSDEEVFPPETAAQFRSNDRQALESESSVQTVETLEHADGILHHSIVNKFAIPGPGGRAALVGGVAIDITELKEAEEALRQSEERYRTLFDLGPVAVYSCDREGVIQNFNRRAAELWGREPAPGDTDPRFCGSFKMFRPDGSFMPHEQCPMAEVVAGTVSEVRDGEVHIERPDGTRITVVVNIRPLKNQRGEVTGAINCFYDITARKEAEEGRARLSAIVESSDDAIVSKDLNGVITSWNAGAERLYGYTAQDVVGQPVSLLIPPDRLNEEPTVLARIRRGEVVEPFETVRRRKDGTLVDVSLTVSPILNSQGQVVGASKIARDITERKKAAETLLEADRHKNEFLAMLAHELRNPLAPILVSIEILRRAKKLEGVERLELSPGVDHALDVLQRQVGQMVRLVDDLLDAGRISRGKIDLRRERVEVASVVRHAVEAARPIAERRGQELTIALPTVPVYVNADPTRMAQIVGNLLNNACKFTEPGGHIWLTVERVEESRPDQTEAASNGLAPQIVISVRDTGVGIAPDRLEGIFDMFTQLDTSLERSLTGLGIGLALVRTLVEMHGGTVRASSPGIGQGSEFVVRLPIVTEAAIQVPLSPTTEPAVTPLRILIVDDNHDSADMLATLLKFSGHETHTAHDGMAAVEAAIKLDPDVILLDIGLPQLNGYEAAHRIREQNSGRGRPVLVALTGWGQDEDRRRSEEAGFDAHVVKPVDHASLHKLLAELGSRNQTVEP